jgi:hypothetical protein
MTLLIAEGGKQMAQYNLAIPGGFVRQIRSNFEDNLAASMGLRVMNAEGGLHHQWDPKEVTLGSYGAGGGVSVSTTFYGLSYVNVDVPDPTPESADGGAIYWSFILVNASNPADSNLVNALTTAADSVAGDLLGSGDYTAAIIGGLILGTDLLVRLLDVSCDGIVAAQNWAWTAAELVNMTAGDKHWSHTQNYPGTSSPFACGAPSDYDVYYDVSRGPAIVVPNVEHQSFRDAIDIAHRAGFGIQAIRNVVSVSVEEPTVEYQLPHHGSLVPPGTTIEVVVANPPPIRR